VLRELSQGDNVDIRLSPNCRCDAGKQLSQGDNVDIRRCKPTLVNIENNGSQGDNVDIRQELLGEAETLRESLKGIMWTSGEGVGANLQMHLCERLGNPAKFVRVSEAVNGQPDPPARPCIPQKPAGVPVCLRQIAYASCTNQPADATCPQYRALAPFPKKLLASRITGNGKRFALRKGLAAVVDSSERTSKKLFGIFKGSSDTSLNIRYVFE
jgi:hypothetical protein